MVVMDAAASVLQGSALQHSPPHFRVSFDALVTQPLASRGAEALYRASAGPEPAVAAGFGARAAGLMLLARGRPFSAMACLALGHVLESVNETLATYHASLGGAALDRFSDAVVVMGLAGVSLFFGVALSERWWAVVVFGVVMFLYVFLGSVSAYSMFVRDNTVPLLMMYILAVAPVFLEAEKNRERRKLAGLWNSSGLVNDQHLLPTYYRSGQERQLLTPFRRGVAAGVALVFPYVYCCVIATWRCSLVSPAPPKALCADARTAPIFSNVYQIVHGDDFMPVFFFFLSHCITVSLWWSAGVPQGAVVAAAGCFALAESATFFAGFWHLALNSAGLALYCGVLFYLAFAGNIRDGRAPMLRATAPACGVTATVLLASVALLPANAPGDMSHTSFFEYTHFSAAEYTLVILCSYAAYQVVVERGAPEERFVRSKSGKE